MIECVDLYCGAGGLSLGLKQAGLTVRAAFDSDSDCMNTYRSNFDDTIFVREDLNLLQANVIRELVDSTKNLVLAGGPPCQLFSRLNRHPAKNTDGVRAYVRLVRAIEPGYILFENVPAIMKQPVAWLYLIRALKRLKYSLDFGIIKAVEYGVPQQRLRTFVIGSRSPIRLPSGSSPVRTVRDAISHLSERDGGDDNHVGLKLSHHNLNRIRRLRDGDNSRERGVRFADSYARMTWDKPAPTITTKCISFSNGRFGHPEYDRAITIREAALLQGFPESFRFCGSLWSCARQVGNAVPPPIAKAMGEVILTHFEASRT